ncbi:Alpha-1,3-mannosyltransferase cmt1 [Stylosanthes scabra]|uniref:Alpha-1,3-mannosyltransferase cmt1 n=1 Tax=Stylosanthes scabra TaxID=79078 RepID=A0ABU6YM03_9FABA|nr:Alpha-1,3-mannosyltransferase cmt1 [Stylosanthes scabra]
MVDTNDIMQISYLRNSEENGGFIVLGEEDISTIESALKAIWGRSEGFEKEWDGLADIGLFDVKGKEVCTYCVKIGHDHKSCPMFMEDSKENNFKEDKRSLTLQETRRIPVELPAHLGGTLPAELEWNLPADLRLRVYGPKTVDKGGLKAPNTHSSLSWCWVSVDSTSQPPPPHPQCRPQPLPSLSLLSLTVSLSVSHSKLFPIGAAFSNRVLHHQPPCRSISGLHLLTNNGNTKDDLRLPTDDGLLTQLQKSHLILKNLRWKGFLLFAMLILIMLSNQECILSPSGVMESDYREVLKEFVKRGLKKKVVASSWLCSQVLFISYMVQTSRTYQVPDYAMSFVRGTSRKPFGHLWWDEIVSTIVTRVEPHNQAVLHPKQDQVLTIRQNARLQGFPDCYLVLLRKVTVHVRITTRNMDYGHP